MFYSNLASICCFIAFYAKKNHQNPANSDSDGSKFRFYFRMASDCCKQCPAAVQSSLYSAVRSTWSCTTRRAGLRLCHWATLSRSTSPVTKSLSTILKVLSVQYILSIKKAVTQHRDIVILDSKYWRSLFFLHIFKIA